MSNMLKPVELPAGVEAVVKPNHLKLKGPKGELEKDVPHQLELQYEDTERRIRVSRRSNDRRSRCLHGTYRTLLTNMVEGVTKGFEKRMEIHGMGYSVDIRGDQLVLQIGFCHDTVFDIPAEIKVEIEQKNAQPDTPARFVLRAVDKEALGQFAAVVRAARVPEPYKGKGIRYAGEYVARKEGKAFGGIQ